MAASLLRCIEMVTVAEAERLVELGIYTDPATVAILNTPRDQRVWLRRATERMPGCHQVCCPPPSPRTRAAAADARADTPASASPRR